MLSRRAATGLIPHIKAAASRANQAPHTLHRIRRLALFGSYVNSRRETIGDLDIAIELERIPERDLAAFQAAYPRPAGVRDALWPWWIVAAKLEVAKQVHISYWNVLSEHNAAHHVIFDVSAGLPIAFQADGRCHMGFTIDELAYLGLFRG